MKSLDTNILVHALDTASPHHAACFPLYESLLRDRNTWVLADQVFFELYRLLRNPAVFRHPLTASQATRTIERIRDARPRSRSHHPAQARPGRTRRRKVRPPTPRRSSCPPRR